MNQAIDPEFISEIDKLQEIVEGTISHFPFDDTDDSEWDLEKTYLINHACLWNRPGDVGKECKMLFMKH